MKEWIHGYKRDRSGLVHVTSYWQLNSENEDGRITEYIMYGTEELVYVNITRDAVKTTIVLSVSVIFFLVLSFCMTHNFLVAAILNFRIEQE